MTDMISLDQSDKIVFIEIRSVSLYTLTTCFLTVTDDVFGCTVPIQATTTTTQAESTTTTTTPAATTTTTTLPGHLTRFIHLIFDLITRHP
jgi:hypothetical protein